MKSKKSLIIALVMLGIAILIILGLTSHKNSCLSCINLSSFSPESIRHYIEGFGSWAIVVYVLLYTVNTFSPFFPPIFIMSLAAGAVFGPILGTVALTLGTFAGTTAAFFAARYIGGSWIQKLVQGKGADLYNKLSNNGFFILLPARLVGFPPYGLIDFICGLSKMKYVDFVAATMIGAVPWIITQVLLADRFANFNPKDPVLWGLLIVFILMIVITGKIVKNKQAKET
ncbi:MAG: TVP38/TMEM64 family protein [Candidatus Omnitrophica bacterium]|nr:TVP38/TMEM64 family protein [Candidatus Omnitrophota bacterium]MCB9747421.1 TVP38/TMEM64 family protein [Candidatus Omnitrophota bacterium]